MKLIKLTRGQVAMVDDADYDYLNQWKWCACKSNRTWYAARDVGGRKYKTRIMMHRLILRINSQVLYADHIDGNGLNNQRCNLRIATKSQNGANSSYKNINATSKYRGVHWETIRNRWVAKIKLNGISKHLGCFKNEDDAARCYNEAAKRLHKEFAYTNPV